MKASNQKYADCHGTERVKVFYLYWIDITIYQVVLCRLRKLTRYMKVPVEEKIESLLPWIPVSLESYHGGR